VLQRRARYVAPGDIYEHRFESKFLSGLFAFYLLLTAIYGSSIGYLITGKTMQAVMVKPVTEYTIHEREIVAGFTELRSLEDKSKSVPLSDSLAHRLEELKVKEKRGELKASISYLNLT